MSGLPLLLLLERKGPAMSEYRREDFERVSVPGARSTFYFYCPGCNGSKEDAEIPSVGCPCASYGTGDGAIDAKGVERYLGASDER